MDVADSDLYLLIKKAAELGENITREFVLSVFLQLLRIKKFNASLNILNADQKPSNILITFGWLFCCDYDLAIALDRSLSSTSSRTICRLFWECDEAPGTRPYIADEVLERREIDENTEMYAFGVFLFSLLSKFFNEAQINNDLVLLTIFNASQKMMLSSDKRPQLDYFQLDVLDHALRLAGWIGEYQEWSTLSR
eukprot:TRINITY_DN722_c0_g2_i5.p2 TRINITY_DN722_c0_g2~~TRINITY_DN722_c0_g2_i5.p2  ORF type:complete len:195 (+),score=82.51 TRINITY_DN722_c0_g2_i5:1871-2455(+)